jgi:hypothetical protein
MARKDAPSFLVPEIESNEFEKATAIAPNQHKMRESARGASLDQALDTRNASTSLTYQTEFDEHFSGASFALRSASLFRLTGTVRRPASASSMIPLSPERFTLATRLTLTI